MGEWFYNLQADSPRTNCATADAQLCEDDVPPPPPMVQASCPALSCAPWPHSPVKTAVYERSVGQDVRIRITADPDHLVPYGTIPRLLLLYLCTQARQRRTPHIDLDRSPEDTVRALGLRPVFGRCSSMSRFASQLYALATCRITLHNASCDTTGWPATALANKPLFEDFQFWFAPGSVRRRCDQAWVKLHPEVYRLLIHADPVMVDPWVVAALKKHILALDLYLYARAVRQHHDTAVSVGWDWLTAFWGANYTNPYEFRRKFRRSVAAVVHTVPGSGIVTTDAGVVFPGPESAN